MAAVELAVDLSLEPVVDGAAAAADDIAAAAAPLLDDPNGALVVVVLPPATLGRLLGDPPLALLARAASRSLRSLSAASCLAWLEAVCRTAVDDAGRRLPVMPAGGATDERKRAEDRV